MTGQDTNQNYVSCMFVNIQTACTSVSGCEFTAESSTTAARCALPADNSCGAVTLNGTATACTNVAGCAYIPASDPDGTPGSGDEVAEACASNSTATCRAVTADGVASKCTAVSGCAYVSAASAGLSSTGARLFRAEYETSGKGLWKLWHLHDEDVPCAVCQSTGSLATLMQPGNSVCPSGWSSEYSGFIMSAPYNDNYRTEYICVDAEAEASANSATVDNSADSTHLSPVEIQRSNGDTLEGYTSNAELTCAVCSQPRPAIVCPPIPAMANVTDRTQVSAVKVPGVLSVGLTVSTNAAKASLINQALPYGW
eukprot:COSAG01_NODE_18902_length_1045_cov_1.292812_1_plen_311_part_01